LRGHAGYPDGDGDGDSAHCLTLTRLCIGKQAYFKADALTSQVTEAVFFVPPANTWPATLDRPVSTLYLQQRSSDSHRDELSPAIVRHLSFGNAKCTHYSRHFSWRLHRGARHWMKLTTNPPFPWDWDENGIHDQDLAMHLAGIGGAIRVVMGSSCLEVTR
jgi:hypothetical protein